TCRDAARGYPRIRRRARGPRRSVRRPLPDGKAAYGRPGVLTPGDGPPRIERKVRRCPAGAVRNGASDIDVGDAWFERIHHRDIGVRRTAPGPLYVSGRRQGPALDIGARRRWRHRTGPARSASDAALRISRQRPDIARTAAYIIETR